MLLPGDTAPFLFLLFSAKKFSSSYTNSFSPPFLFISSTGSPPPYPYSPSHAVFPLSLVPDTMSFESQGKQKSRGILFIPL